MYRFCPGLLILSVMLGVNIVESGVFGVGNLVVVVILPSGAETSSNVSPNLPLKHGQ